MRYLEGWLKLSLYLLEAEVRDYERKMRANVKIILSHSSPCRVTITKNIYDIIERERESMMTSRAERRLNRSDHQTHTRRPSSSPQQPSE